MTWALIIDGAVAAYPYSEAQVRADNPGTSFPADLSETDMSAFGVVTVEQVAPPAATAEQDVEEASPVKQGGVWKQAWAVRAKTADELVAAKAALWAQVKAKREEAMAAGCTIPGLGAVDTDAASMDNLTQGVAGAIMAAMASIPFTINWTLADNTVATLNGTQMMAIGKAAGERKALCHVHSQVLRVAIEAAADFATLEAIDITQGWPE